MENTLFSRVKKAWNVFRNRDPTNNMIGYGYGSSYRPDRNRIYTAREQTILGSIINRIALDATSIDMKHVKVDSNDRFIQEVNSALNDCLNLSANIDQTGRAFRFDLFYTLLEAGSIAIVPTDIDDSPDTSDPNVMDTNTILKMRIGIIEDWFPSSIKVSLYNELTGLRESIILEKSKVAVVENPFYSVMNEPNSTMKRLTRKLALLDAIDEQSGSGKLDLIIQLPYAVKTDLKRDQANLRKKNIEDQLVNSKYGIAYIDSTEHITQLNRPVENNLMKQIEYLTSLLYSQLGINQAIMDGTADEGTMINYYHRTIDPLASAPADSMTRVFLTKTARTQGHRIKCYRDPFKLITAEQLAKVADTYTRNEILTANEIRQYIGIKPSDDPRADLLKNSNINRSDVDIEMDKEMEDKNEFIEREG